MSARITIEHGIERVWGFLTDYDGLAAHLTGLSSSRLLGAHNGYKIVEQVGRPGVPLLPAELTVRLKVVETPPRLICFEQLEGDLKSFRGSWELAPAGAGRTLLCYRLSAAPRGPIPAALIRPVLRRGVEEALRQVKAAVERPSPAPVGPA